MNQSVFEAIASRLETHAGQAVSVLTLIGPTTCHCAMGVIAEIAVEHGVVKRRVLRSADLEQMSDEEVATIVYGVGSATAARIASTRHRIQSLLKEYEGVVLYDDYFSIPPPSLMEWLRASGAILTSAGDDIVVQDANGGRTALVYSNDHAHWSLRDCGEAIRRTYCH